MGLVSPGIDSGPSSNRIDLGATIITRAGVFVDVDFAVAMTKRHQAPVVSALVPALQRKFQPFAGVSLFGSRQSFAPELVADWAKLRYVNSKIVSGNSADLALAVAAMRELPKIDHLVLVSGDADFVDLAEAAKDAGVETTMVAPQQALAFRLMARNGQSDGSR
jgi:uncharacterized LabA/DUF88 family protein